MITKTTLIVLPNKNMKKILALFSFGFVLLTACSTTNRQVIIECDGRHCNSLHPRPNVVAKMSYNASNMVATNSAIINYSK